MAPAEPPAVDESVLLENASRTELSDAHRRCPEGIAVPSVMRALMDFLGESFGSTIIEAHGTTWRRDHAYTYFAGVSGEAFRFAWAQAIPPGGFGPGDGPGDPVEPYERAFAASGYDHEIVLHAGFSARVDNAIHASAGHERLRSRLVRSVSSGKPVVAAGITSKVDTCLLTGFGDRGDIVLGWKMEPGGSPGILFEPDKRFRFDDWYPSTFWMVFLGDRRGLPNPRDTYLGALARGSRHLTTSLKGTFSVGPDALERWAEALREGVLRPVADADAPQPSLSIVDPCMWDFAERRWYAARFVEGALPEFPDCGADLGAAVRALDEEHDLMWRIDKLLRRGADDEQGKLRNLADRVVRQEMAGIVDACRAKDAEVAALLDRVVTP